MKQPNEDESLWTQVQKDTDTESRMDLFDKIALAALTLLAFLVFLLTMLRG